MNLIETIRLIKKVKEGLKHLESKGFTELITHHTDDEEVESYIIKMSKAIKMLEDEEEMLIKDVKRSYDFKVETAEEILKTVHSMLNSDQCPTCPNYSKQDIDDYIDGTKILKGVGE